MNSEIISVGTELMTGSILNTNTQYLSKRLSELGFRVHNQTAVGDNRERLEKALDSALENNDLIVLTGGLGPTQDDLTKEAVAEALGRDLILDKDIEKHLRSFFEEHRIPFTDNNLKQAYLIEGSDALDNPDGTAPGIVVKSQDKTIFLLPGPPREMRNVFENEVVPILNELRSEEISSRYYQLTGIGESQAEDKIMELVLNQNNPTIATYAKPGEILVRLTATGADREALLDETEKALVEKLGKNIFTYSQDSLTETVCRFLIDHHLTISSAESCTGGMVSEEITSVAGVSEVFLLGVVSYSNAAKEKILHVNKEDLEKYGAVSEEVCRQMCENVRKLSGSDIGVSTTGIAGPGGGTEEKPVGLVYTGIATDKGTVVRRNLFYGDRTAIRTRSTNMVFQMIRKEFFKSY